MFQKLFLIEISKFTYLWVSLQSNWTTQMNASDILKSKGIKKSAQRIAIINILQQCYIPMAESEIKDKLGDIYDRITFYRTIQTLLSAGIIHRVVIDNLTVKYAFNEEQDHDHVHFFCKVCGEVTCWRDIVPHGYKLPRQFVPQECEVLIKGICDKCNDKKHIG